MSPDREKRVIYTTISDISGFGGVETMMQQEVPYLRAKGFEVYLLTLAPKGVPRVKEAEGIHIRYFPRDLWKAWWPLRYLMLAIWFFKETSRIASRGDALSVSYTVLDGSGPALVKLFGGKLRMVLRIVGPFSFEVEHYFPKETNWRYKLYGRLTRSLELLSYRSADTILPVSEFEESNILGYGVPRDKVRTIRCGIDEHLFDGDRGRGPLQIPEGRKVLMFVGRLVEKNGPLVVAEAAPMVLKEVPESMVVFVGDGPLRGRISEMLEREIAQGRVVITGFRNDVNRVHAHGDVYAGHLSNMVEGLGQTVFEAMMSGLPVVTGRDRISEKIIADGVNGVLVRKEDSPALAAAVVALMKDRAKRRSIGEAARAYALQNLSFESMMKEVLREF